MRKRRLIFILLPAIFCLSIDGRIVNGTNLTGYQEKPPSAQYRSPFRYVIAWNKVTEGTRYPEGGPDRFRGVNVLLDPKAFSESNLLQLVELLSKRFPKPEDLIVNIYSDLDDVLTPEENDIFVSGPIDLSATPKHAWAFYIRNDEVERLDYHTKKPDEAFRSIDLRRKGRTN